MDIHVVTFDKNLLLQFDVKLLSFNVSSLQTIWNISTEAI